MKNKSPSWREARESVRAVKAAGLAFIGAKRRALTEQAGGWRRLAQEGRFRRISGGRAGQKMGRTYEARPAQIIRVVLLGCSHLCRFAPS